MAYIRKIKAALVKQDSSNYIGEESYLFYDIETACLRISDGTPGGRPACIEGASAGVVFYPVLTDFPSIGEADVIYGSDATNVLYRWDGTNYIQLTATSATTHDSAAITIVPGDTATLMTILPTNNLSIKFIISVVDTATGRFASSEVLGSYNVSNNSVSHMQYSKLGDKIKYRPEVIFSTPNIELTITNNDVNDITVSVTRIPTLNV